MLLAGDVASSSEFEFASFISQRCLRSLLRVSHRINVRNKSDKQKCQVTTTVITTTTVNILVIC